jgi:hypothetical protein
MVLESSRKNTDDVSKSLSNFATHVLRTRPLIMSQKMVVVVAEILFGTGHVNVEVLISPFGDMSVG